jgi:glycogen operon protein
VLGASCRDGGVNFALYSAYAEAVELCLFDASGEREIGRALLPGRDGDIWHGFLPGAEAGCCYGYRVHGAYAPGLGHRFNPHKLLLDPYARELRGQFRWHDSHFGYHQGNDALPDPRDNAPWMPKCVVLGEVAEARHGPGTPWPDTVIYEMHLRGFTMRHPAVPDSERGTVAALGSDAIVDYLRALGITAVELLPVHAFIDEHFLYQRGRSNYWGYNTLSFFAPHTPYLGGQDSSAFRRMVERLHDAGLEVILDVVYNHSCEGNAYGPTLSFRGIDNASYYRLLNEDPARYINDTGCGNTLATHHPAVRRLVLDSLRYWAGSMGVDGFRFDLGTVLARCEHGFDPNAALLTQIGSDPLLSRCKLITEPWDLGPGGYRLGGFPGPWAEWNDRCRDSLRRFWRGDPGELPELARRLHGSGDIFEGGGRSPWSSINFITSHDGFTLLDLVSYARRHNESNGEGNRDGHSENFSDNYGVEGPTEDPAIRAVRARQQRNLLATLLLCQGVPMLQAGDELGRTQRGNNNAYCQDNPGSWIDWKHIDEELQEFVRRLLQLRASEPLLRADLYRHANPGWSGQTLQWLAPEGGFLDAVAWQDRRRACVGCLITQNTRNNQTAHALLLLLNAGTASVDFVLPVRGADWLRRVDTEHHPYVVDGEPVKASPLRLSPRSLQLLVAAA